MKKKFNFQFSVFKCLVFIFQFSVFSFQLAYPQVKFENPQINSEGRYLFTVSHQLGGTVSYKTLFMAQAGKADSARILTCFPERGKWACYVKKTDAATGKLYLRNMSTLEEFLLNDKCDFDYDQVPAKWAGDGSVFVYEKAGNIYFGDPKAVQQKVQMEESFRKIGEGSINCVTWTGSGSIPS